MSVNQYWKEINIASEKVSSLINSFWHEHSDWGTVLGGTTLLTYSTYCAAD